MSSEAALYGWMRRRIAAPLLRQLQLGLSAERLALAVAIGVVVGNIPIFGASTLLCALIALAFGLNQPAIQFAQAAMAPTQLLLIVPFVRMGDWLLRAPPGRSRSRPRSRSRRATRGRPPRCCAMR